MPAVALERVGPEYHLGSTVKLGSKGMGEDESALRAGDWESCLPLTIWGIG